MPFRFGDRSQASSEQAQSRICYRAVAIEPALDGVRRRRGEESRDAVEERAREELERRQVCARADGSVAVGGGVETEHLGFGDAHGPQRFVEVGEEACEVTPKLVVGVPP